MKIKCIFSNPFGIQLVMRWGRLTGEWGACERMESTLNSLAGLPPTTPYVGDWEPLLSGWGSAGQNELDNLEWFTRTLSWIPGTLIL